MFYFWICLISPVQSESDLEDVLTFYTHKNKSASVFLGSSRRDHYEECGKGSGALTKHHSRRSKHLHSIYDELICMSVKTIDYFNISNSITTKQPVLF